MKEEFFFNKIPQSVLLTGTSLPFIFQFFKKWSARLLQVQLETLETHPDFHLIRPVNKMRQIQVETLRSLNREVYMSAQQGGHKVFGILEADRLHVSAANAMLKTLEEPSGNTSLFLITTKPYQVLPTLRSRCWWIRINDAEQSEVETFLKEWLEAFQSLVILYLKKEKALNPLEIYGLLYRFQACLNQQKGIVKAKAKFLSEEELEAEEVGYEKQLIQEAFYGIENVLSILFHDGIFHENSILFSQWIQMLEACYKRTEVNFGSMQALEYFLIQFLKDYE